MSSNVSDVNLLEKRQRQVLITHAGLDFFVSSRAERVTRPGTLCTLGFAVKQVRSTRGGTFDHGFLTLGTCLPTNQGRNYAAFHVRHRNQVEEVIRIGSVRGPKHAPARGLSYATLKLSPNDDDRVL